MDTKNDEKRVVWISGTASGKSKDDTKEVKDG